MFAVVQKQCQDAAARAIERLQLPVVSLASVGGFLGRQNTVLLIGLEKVREQAAIKALEEASRQRLEYFVFPLEASLSPMRTPVPVIVSGATVFALPVEHFEEI